MLITPSSFALFIQLITEGRERLNNFATAVDFQPDNISNNPAILTPIHAPSILSAIVNKVSRVIFLFVIFSAFMFHRISI